MKKKVAAIFMASIMAFSLAACGSNGGSSDSGKDRFRRIRVQQQAQQIPEAEK